MRLRPIAEVTTVGQAEDIAKDWQQLTSEQSLSYGELAADHAYFEELATKFNLTDVFKENGII